MAGSTTVEEFSVLGFHLRGRVLRFRGDNTGVAGVTVTLSGASANARSATSDSDGYYAFSHLQDGSYSLAAHGPHIMFEAKHGVEVTATTTRLPDLVGVKYDVCGVVHLADLPASRRTGQPLPRTMRLRSVDGQAVAQDVDTDGEGHFCFQVAPGVYEVDPQVTDAETAGGLVLTPSPQKVEVTALHGGSLQVDFEPAQVSVSGTVACLDADDCTTAVSVFLQPVTGAGARRTAKWYAPATVCRGCGTGVRVWLTRLAAFTGLARLTARAAVRSSSVQCGQGSTP